MKQESDECDYSVVIPTRDRADLLGRCLAAIGRCTPVTGGEVVVVNDSASPLAAPPALPAHLTLRVVQAAGQGPAAARNLGILAARGPIVIFTDDDTVPDRDWLARAVSALQSRPELVGVEGRTHCRDWDLLEEHSVRNSAAGAYWTCNVAYRKSALIAADGFDEGFPLAHCEDLDIGRLLATQGSIAYDPEMSVEHPPRPIRTRALVRRGALVESEWRYHLRHPETTPARWSWRTGPLVRMARRWQIEIGKDLKAGRYGHAIRCVGVGAGQLLLAIRVTALHGLRRPPLDRMGLGSRALTSVASAQ